jgi:hypothetical protein
VFLVLYAICMFVFMNNLVMAPVYFCVCDFNPFFPFVLCFCYFWFLCLSMSVVGNCCFAVLFLCV